MRVAGAAGAAGQIVFERRVAPGGGGHRLEGRGGERGPPEIRVHDDAGGVDDGLERRLELAANGRRCQAFDALGDRLFVGALQQPAAHLLPHLRGRLAQGVDDRGAPVARFELLDRPAPAQLLDGRDQPEAGHFAIL